MTRSLHLETSQKTDEKRKTETHTVDLTEESDLLSFILMAHRNKQERNWWKRKAFFCNLYNITCRKKNSYDQLSKKANNRNKTLW